MWSLEISNFSSPTEVIHGLHSLNLLGSKVKHLGARKVFFITDSRIRDAGVLEEAFGSLEDNKVPLFLSDQVLQDPEEPTIQQLVSLLHENECDCVIAAGGGSIMCAGKATALVAANGGSISEYVGTEKYRRPPLLCIAIPTTAGSGSEVSKHTIITDERTKRKTGIRGYTNAPRLAILDPIVLKSVPRMQAVSSGLDALTHAIEAFCSRRATPITDSLALTAIKIIAENLCPSILGDDLEAKSKMLLASCVANMACGNAGLGLVHAMNGIITRTYKLRGYEPVDYGLIHSICLPHVLEFNLPASESKLAAVATAFGIKENGKSEAKLAKKLVERLKENLTYLDAPRKLPWKNVSAEVISEMANEVLGNIPQHSANPRKSTEEDLIDLFEKTLVGWD